MTKDEALIDLCRSLLQDPKLVSQEGWQKLIVICEIEDGATSVFGYSYKLSGEGKLTAPSVEFNTDKLKALHEVMKAENASGRGWLKCMIRISRNGEVGADFEYNDARRWEHTADNYQERIAEYAAMPV